MREIIILLVQFPSIYLRLLAVSNINNTKEYNKREDQIAGLVITLVSAITSVIVVI